MLTTDWAILWPFTLWQLLFSHLTQILSFGLSVVAFITEMGAPPTKILGKVATEFAFKRYKLFPMFFTIFCWNRATLWADEFWRIKVWGIWFVWVIHHFSTVLSAPKIWFFAFITLKIGINSHGILNRLFVIFRFFISKFGILLQLLKLKPFHCFLFQSCFQLFQIFHFLLNREEAVNLNPLFAQRAFTKIKYDSWG